MKTLLLETLMMMNKGSKSYKKLERKENFHQRFSNFQYHIPAFFKHY